MLKIEGLYDSPREESRANGPDRVAREGVFDARVPELVVTQIRSGVKNPNRVNIYINKKYELSLDLGQVVDLKVKVGRVLSERELQELRAASEFGKLYQRALEWALMRPRSMRETQDYLKQQQRKRSQTNRQRQSKELKPLPEIQDVTIRMVIERLTERGFVDDEKFTEYYIENRFVKKGISKRRLQQELRKKGISENVITNSLAKVGRDEGAELMKMIEKKRRRYGRDTLIQYLVRQGFDYYAVVEAVETAGVKNSDDEG